jgi:hypothetical protein
MEIYCVKIRQTELKYGTRTYFPFERLYLVPDAFLENDYWKQMFKYMFVIEMPTDKLLNELRRVAGLRHRGAIPKEVEEGYRVVVPTYIQNGKLGYMWSYLKKAQLQGLDLSLYTPQVVIPSMCYQCTRHVPSRGYRMSRAG